MDLTPFYITLGFILASGGIGFYIGRVGLTGLEADITAIKTDLSTVKTAVVPTVVSPAVSKVTSAPISVA
jgi:hypothetical protein